jgi:large subunit ribosomal protein LP2
MTSRRFWAPVSGRPRPEPPARAAPSARAPAGAARQQRPQQPVTRPAPRGRRRCAITAAAGGRPGCAPHRSSCTAPLRRRPARSRAACERSTARAAGQPRRAAGPPGRGEPPPSLQPHRPRRPSRALPRPADRPAPSLPAVGVEADAANVSKLLSELEGKDLSEVMAAGKKKLASVPAAGPAAAPAAGGAAAGGAAPAAAAKKEESSEEEEVRGSQALPAPRAAARSLEIARVAAPIAARAGGWVCWAALALACLPIWGASLPAPLALLRSRPAPAARRRTWASPCSTKRLAQRSAGHPRRLLEAASTSRL